MRTNIIVLMAERGACRNADPDLFFPNHDEDSYEYKMASRVAKSICESCPVKVECEEHAVRYEDYGIWGGLTPQERRRRRRDATD